MAVLVFFYVNKMTLDIKKLAIYDNLNVYSIKGRGK